MIEGRITAIVEKRGTLLSWRKAIARAPRLLRRGLLDLVRGAVSWAEVPDVLLVAFSRSLLASSVSPLPNAGGVAIQAEQKFLNIIGTIALTGNYPGAPGEVFDITKLALPPGWTLPAVGALVCGWAWSINPAGSSGFSYTVIPGSLQTNGRLDVQQGGGAATPNGEIPTAAYPAGVLGDTIQFEVLVTVAG
jgi:hypothetical protein